MNRLNSIFKLLFLAKIFILCLIFSLKSFADDLSIKKNMIVIGSYDAIVKIKIFSSLTCPHCANFHMKVVPEIKKEYVASGKVQLIFIDFPLDQAAFNASKLLHCADKKNQMDFLDVIYKTQSNWAEGSTINEINSNLKKIANNLGINSMEFDKCLINEVVIDKILTDRIEGNQKYSINSTPTIVINEKKLEGSTIFKNIKKKIEKII